MKTRRLKTVLERVEVWPPEAQDELAAFVDEIEAALGDEPYQPTRAELAEIDRGLRDAADGRFATEQDVEAAFAKLRRS
jgi:predicted transcriptional regulator